MQTQTIPNTGRRMGRPRRSEGPRGADAMDAAREKFLTQFEQAKDFLRAHEGQKFHQSSIAQRFGMNERAFSRKFTALVSGLGAYCSFRREAGRRGAVNFVTIWYGSTPREDASALESRVFRWMGKNPKPVRASVLAKALGESADAVFTTLQAMHARRDVVRCELVLRSGVDRYEFRLMGRV